MPESTSTVSSKLPTAEPTRQMAVVTEEIEYLTADEEEKYTIAQANTLLDAEGNILD